MARNDDSGFSEYFAGRAATMRSTAYLLCGNWHQAEDLVQIAFAKLYSAWPRLARRGALDGYVRKTLVHAYLDERRRASWQREQLTDLVPEPARRPVARPDERLGDRLLVLAALAEVPPRQRAVLVLRFWDDLSVQDTAAALGCSTGTVKSQSARGLEALRRALAALGEPGAAGAGAWPGSPVPALPGGTY
jgi:RNA polymerase sigma-70 factor (sigma-E family)